MGCIAVANDEENALEMLKRRPEESLMDLLHRLDLAIERAIDDEEYADEINN